MFRLTNKNDNLSFQDYIIELLLKKSSNKPVVKPAIPPTPPSAPKQDILSAMPQAPKETPFVTPETPAVKAIIETEVIKAPEEATISDFNPQISSQDNSSQEASA
jgi:hypothetical protein